MTLETTIQTGRASVAGSLSDLIGSHWRRAWPVVALAAVFVVSLVGLYAIGRSVQDRVGRPGGQAAAASPGAVAQMARALTRVGWSQPDVPVDVVLVTPEYFRAVGWLPKPEMNPRDHLIFMVSENIHDGDLAAFVATELRVGGQPIGQGVAAQVLAASPHHRTVALAYPRPKDPSQGGAPVQLVFAAGNGAAASVLTWDQAALGDSDAAGAGGSSALSFHLTGASFLALLGGMLASMWPCLFQLTAYFIPSLAGVSMSETRGAISPATRWRVVKMATFFVVGFIVVYTLAGAAAGLAAQSFGTQSIIETWRRPLTLVSGMFMLVLALRIAARARLPLVCKMPLVNRVAKGSQPGYGSAMVMGLAYATGCATCFGAALLLGMLVYVGVAGAPLTGAAVMFLFSVGMGVPLIVGAALMAQVLPFLEKLGLHARYLSLMSSAMMVAMAVLLLSDRFMSFSNQVARLAG